MIAYNLLHRALVAQGIERLPPEQKAAGSNPVKGTSENTEAGRTPGLFWGCPYSMSERISPGSSPASRNILRVTKFHTMTMNVAPIFTMR